MSKGFAGLIGIVGISTGLMAAEAWQIKPVREWTREETMKFFRESPWIRQVSISEPAFGAAAHSMSAESGVASEPRAGDAPDMMSTSTPRKVTNYYIQWSSAKIYRQAYSHGMALQGGPPEPEEQPSLPYYLLTIGGQDLRAFAGVTNEQLKAGTYLRTKSIKVKIEPMDISIGKGQDERISLIQLMFPLEVNGQPVISDRDKSIDFQCKIKGLTLRTSFNLAKMVTDQGRDL